MTQLENARKNIITEEMRQVASTEHLDPQQVMNLIADGRIVIPANKINLKGNLKPIGIGRALTTKINANIGASPYHMDLNEELEKLTVAVKYGADAVMDLSLGSQQIEIRRAVLAASPVMVGTVPLYQTGFELAAARRNITAMTIDARPQKVSTS